MALTVNSMSSDIETQLRTMIPAIPAGPLPDLTNFCNAMATAIVNNIKANAELSSAHIVDTDPSSTIDGLPVVGGIA